MELSARLSGYLPRSAWAFTGAVEIGQLNVGFLAGKEAEPLRIIDLPFLYQSREAEWEAEDGEFVNMKMIGWAQYGTVDFYANQPIQLPEDLHGLKMRGFGKGSSLMLQEHGAIDGYSTGPSSVVDRGLAAHGVFRATF